MNTKRQITAFGLVITVMFTFALMALAQATNAAPDAGTTVVSATNMTGLWNAAIVVVVPIVVAGIKKVTPKIPTVLLPIGASALGVLSNWLLTKAGMIPSSSLALGALCGAAGVGVREIADQSMSAVKQALGKTDSAASPPATPSK